jgi:Carboxypeptidase regulatory-like domain
MRLNSHTAFLLLFASLPAAAQTVTGTILGVVSDPTGAVVPRATVSAANQATGFTRSAESDAEGNYAMPRNSTRTPCSRPRIRSAEAAAKAI